MLCLPCSVSNGNETVQLNSQILERGEVNSILSLKKMKESFFLFGRLAELIGAGVAFHLGEIRKSKTKWPL